MFATRPHQPTQAKRLVDIAFSSTELTAGTAAPCDNGKISFKKKY
jgi:hypothetical protein